MLDVSLRFGILELELLELSFDLRDAATASACNVPHLRSMDDFVTNTNSSRDSGILCADSNWWVNLNLCANASSSSMVSELSMSGASSNRIFNLLVHTNTSSMSDSVIEAQRNSIKLSVL